MHAPHALAAAALALVSTPTLAQQRVFSTSASSYCLEATAGAGSGSTFSSQRVSPFDMTSATGPVGVGLFAPTFFIPPNIFDTWSFIPLPLNATATSGGPNGASLSSTDAANYAGPEGVLIARRGGSYCLNAQGFAGATCTVPWSEATTTARYRVVDPYGCLPTGAPVVLHFSVELRSIAAVNALGRRGATTDSVSIFWACQSNSTLIQGRKQYDAHSGWVVNDPAPEALWQYAVATTVGGPATVNYMRVVAQANASSDGASLLPDEPDYAEFNLVLAIELRDASITDPLGNPMPFLSALDEHGNVIVDADDPGCSPADLSCPYAVLDFSDIAAFLLAFSDQDPAADLAEPIGQWDFSDIVEFLNVFFEGCP